MVFSRNKKDIWQAFVHRGRILTLVLLFTTAAVGAANVASAQETGKRISIRLENVSVLDALREINRLSGNVVVFRSEEVEKESKRVSLDMQDAPVADVVKAALKGTSLNLIERDGRIVVVPQQLENVKITGTVRDEDNQPLPGVTILVKGMTIGTVSDHNGHYSLTLPEMGHFSLLYSFIGMETQEIPYRGDNVINVVMHEDSQEIDEVVVTGYQTLKKRSMAGSSSSVKAEDLLLTGTQTLEQALQGKLPGVAIVNQSGLTGTRQKVRVRGTSTLVGNAEPVWVVDGIIQEDPLPFNASELTDIGDNAAMIKNFIGGAISWLNPNDIEDITVLKDASATAIYGVKAANGVIVITTKKGERGRLSLSYSGNFSLSARMNYRKLELMNSKERVDASREAFMKGSVLTSDEPVGYMALALAYRRREISFAEFNAGVKELEQNNTDWFDILFQTPFSHSHSISISGGDDRATYRASIGYTNTQNTAKGNKQESYTGNLSMSGTYWKKLFLTIGLSGSLSKTSGFSGTDPYGYASTTNRALPCYDKDGELYFYQKTNGFRYNILHELYNSGNENTSSSINANVNLRWLIGHGFSFSSVFGYNYSTTYGESYYTEQTNEIASIRKYEFGEYGPGDDLYKASPLPFGGRLTVNETQNYNYTWRNQIEYNELLGGVHMLTFMLGEEIRSNKYTGYTKQEYGYMPDRGKSFADVPPTYGEGDSQQTNLYITSNYPTITDRVSNYLSLYATLNYMYDDRYALNASIRTDASNRFGQDKSARYLPVWSVGLRWNLTKEHWMENQNILNDVSLRASYGWQGNVVEAVGPDLIAKIERVNYTTGEYKMTISRLPTPNLRWEKNKSVNFGIDFSILGSRINGSFEYYYKRTVDMITSRQVPYEEGTTELYLNGGNMSNHGWDLSFSFVPVRTKDFVWNLGFNTSYVSNEVETDLEPTGNWREATSGSLNKDGYAVSSFWAFRFNGLDPQTGGPTFDLSGAEKESAELDATEYLTYAGKLDADITAGLNTSFRYKNLYLSANFYLSVGNQKFLSSPYSEENAFGGETARTMASEYTNLSSQLLDRWRKPSDEKYTNIPVLPNPETTAAMYPFYNEYTALYPYEAWAYSDIRVVDAWYLRCNNISLSYTMPDKFIKGFAQNVSLSASVSNPFQIVSRDFLGRDPEVASGQQPLSRNYTLSVSVSF